MKFTAIRGKPLGTGGKDDITHSELCEFFVEHVFMTFMEHGRKGFEMAAWLIVVNFEAHYLVKLERKREMTNISRRKLSDQITMWLIDGFISRGTSGLQSAVHSASTAVWNDLASH